VNDHDARDLLAELLGQIAPEVDLDDVDPEAPLQQEVDLDSMDFLNLMSALHERTGLDVPERDYPRLASVQGFVDYLANAPSGGAPQSIPSRPKPT
jgi:acyl carrier protein